MEVTTAVRSICGTVSLHPRITYWWLKNRLRQVSLVYEYNFGGGKSFAPRSVSLRPTFLCNAKCKMCSFANSAGPDGDLPITWEREMLPFEVARRLADDVVPNRTCITLTGGEPGLWPPLFRFFDHVRRLGGVTTIISNGTPLLRRVDELIAAPPDVLCLSVLGPAEVHDEIVGVPGSHDRIMELIDRVNEAKKGKRFAAPLIVTNTPMLMDNAHCFSEVGDLGRKHNVFATQFQHLWFTTDLMRQAHQRTSGEYRRNYTESMALDPGAVDPLKIWKEMERTRSRENGTPVLFYPDLNRREVVAYYSEPLALVKRKRAVCAWIFAHVLPNGDISPCLGHVVGNLKEKGFYEIWNSPDMIRYRCDLREKGTFPICGRCCVYFRSD